MNIYLRDPALAAATLVAAVLSAIVFSGMAVGAFAATEELQPPAAGGAYDVQLWRGLSGDVLRTDGAALVSVADQLHALAHDAATARDGSELGAAWDAALQAAAALRDEADDEDRVPASVRADVLRASDGLVAAVTGGAARPYRPGTPLLEPAPRPLTPPVGSLDTSGLDPAVPTRPSLPPLPPLRQPSL